MKVLVTGAAGFIGSYVCELLTERGHEFIGLDCLVPQVHPEWPDGVIHPLTDLGRDPLNVQDVDAVIHLAARVGVGQSMDEPVPYVQSNVLGTARLMEAMKLAGVHKLVVASSMSVYGEGSMTEGVKEDWPLNPRSVYAQTKLSTEQLAMTLGAYNNIDTTALRFFNCYGPRQTISNPYTGLGAIFSRQILNNERPTVFEDGKQIRDFIHVRDVARAVLSALEAPGGHILNIGTGEPTSVLSFAQTLCDAHGTELEPEVTGHVRTGDIRACYADATKASKVLDWVAEIPLAEGLADLVEWLAGAQVAR